MRDFQKEREDRERAEKERIAAITKACPVETRLYRVSIDDYKNNYEPVLREASVVRVTPVFIFTAGRVYGWSSRIQKGLIGREVFLSAEEAWRHFAQERLERVNYLGATLANTERQYQIAQAKLTDLAQ